MLEKFSNIFRLPDLRKRIGFTLGLLAVYRIGFHVPTPGINADMLAQFFNQNAGSALGLLDLFAGGNLRKLTIFALGIMPYITASIIFQLLTVIYEPLAKLQKEGEVGRRKITQWTRYVTVLLAIVQSFFIAITLTGQGMITVPKPAFVPLCIITLTCGTAFIMWLGEQITDRGIGNGMSLLIFTGIVVGLPGGINELWNKAETHAWGGFTPLALLLLVSLMIAVVAFIIFVERSERRIPIQSAKRVVGRSIRQASNSFLPLKVNSGGVMPVMSDCGGAGRIPIFLGTSDALRLVTSYSMAEGARGYPQFDEFRVVRGDEGVRLIVTEHLYTSPSSTAPFCGGEQPMVDINPSSFIVADRLASCVFSYRETLPDAPPSAKWLPGWDKAELPGAVKIEMTPLDSSPALLPVMNVTVPIHVTRQVRPTYDDQ